MTEDRSIRDFKYYVLRKTGVETVGEFCELSDSHYSFWQLLNEIGWKRKTKPPEETEDVDGTAFVTENEWSYLEKEFAGL